MTHSGRQSRRAWTVRLALLALLLQLVAGGHPMAAPARDTFLPAWLAGSICSSGDGAPAVPDRDACTDCLLLCHAAATPPAVAAEPVPPPPASPPVALGDAPPAVKDALSSLSARGPPLA